MPGKNLHPFFLSIVFPSILAIGLFILSIFVVILPSFEKNIMDKKKEMISELTNTAWSLLEEYDQEYRNNKISKEEAQRLAASRIEKMRYGDEHKDYFWIIDQHPTMIMHPYRSELTDSDLTNYKDPAGKKLFIEATRTVAQKGEGFIDYIWQWKDDSSRIVPKLSYVKAYKPWGWIIGTGIYLEDVKEEISLMKARLLRISLLITLIIVIILLFIIKQSLIIENQRKDAEAKLVLSRQKYKTLVEASTDGILMVLNKTITFTNAKFNNLIGYETNQVLSLVPEDIFKADWEQITSSIDDPKKSLSFETQIKCFDNTEKDVIVSISKIKFAEDEGYIIVTKEITGQKQIEKETEQLSQELQTFLLLMNQPIQHFIQEILLCSMETSIRDAAILMTTKKKKILFIHKDNEIIGVINDSDLKKRVIAENISTQKTVMQIMTSPVISISENSLLYEAILLFKSKNISHLAIKNENGVIKGAISYEDVAGMQQNSMSYLIKEIEVAEDLEHLQKIYKRVPVLVNALLESGDKTQNITRIISSVSDAITGRIITLAIESTGKPPCGFAFMVMGSEGRMEQTLSTDQDNAIVFDDLQASDLNTASSYFYTLGYQITQNLNTIGYKFCDGEIMARNPKWVQPISVWKQYFTEWINLSDPQSLLDASIFFDFRCVYGNKNLIDNLRNHVNKVVENKSVFFYHLAQSVIKYRPPVSILGNIIGQDQNSDHTNLDIKKVMFPIIAFIRLYSLKTQLNETNSLNRIKQLHHQNIINKSLYDELVLSYNYLMHIRLRFQTRSISLNKTPDNLIDINKLTHIEITTIKKIFSEINTLQTKVNFDFKGTM
jgi:PAS domain S-box-containing protein